MEEPQRSFLDPAVATAYVQGTQRKVPGLADLHRMATILLAEHAGPTARILVVGAGGGLELKAFAEARPGWRFTGVDPSAPMLAAAELHLGPLSARVELQQGYATAAPAGPFDGATCLLTLHFLEPDERARTLREIHRRLTPGAKLVVAHHSQPRGGDLRRWLGRSLAFAGSADRQMAASVAAMRRLPILAADEDTRMLRLTGFSDVELFYAAFTFRGWVATA
jgi:tRNA (cmo5U34)-methyltransferase